MTINIITSSPRAVVEHIERALEKHWRVSVFVNRDGDVVVGEESSVAMETHLARHPDQLIATYSRRAHAFEITQDLAQALIELTTFGLAKLAGKQKRRIKR